MSENQSHLGHRFTTRDDWFQTEEVGAGVFRITEPHYRADYRCNIYLVKGPKRDIVIDTGLGLASLRKYLQPLSPDPLLICSHSHYDHIGSNWEFSERWIHPAEASIVAAPTHENTYADPILVTEDFYSPPWPGFQARDWQAHAAPATGSLEEGQEIDLGDRQLRVLHTPGHSWGGVCLWDASSGEMFCADTVYSGELFDFLPSSDIPTYVESMRRLRELPVRVAYPGHNETLSGQDFHQIAHDYVVAHEENDEAGS